MKTEQEWKLALARMIPEKICIYHTLGADDIFCWKTDNRCNTQVRDTEWLHVCWLVEKNLKSEYGFRSVKNKHRSFLIQLFLVCNPGSEFTWDSQLWTNCLSASWQQRAQALIGVEK